MIYRIGIIAFYNNLPENYVISELPQKILDRMQEIILDFEIITISRHEDDIHNKIIKFDPMNDTIICTIDDINDDADSLNSSSFNGKYLALNRIHGTINIWDMETGEIIHKISECNCGSRSICLSPNFKQIACAMDKTVKIFDIKTGLIIHHLDKHCGNICNMCYSPDSKYLASMDYTGTIKIWNAEEGYFVNSLFHLETIVIMHNGYVKALSYSPDGKRILSGRDNCIDIWDAKTHTLISTWHGSISEICSAIYLSDGRRILAHDCEGRITLIDSESHIVFWKSEPDKSIYNICCSPNDKHIISAHTSQGSAIFTIRNTKTGFIIKTFKYSYDIGKMQSKYAYGITQNWDIESTKLINPLTYQFGIYTIHKPMKLFGNPKD